MVQSPSNLVKNVLHLIPILQETMQRRNQSKGHMSDEQKLVKDPVYLAGAVLQTPLSLIN